MQNTGGEAGEWGDNCRKDLQVDAVLLSLFR